MTDKKTKKEGDQQQTNASAQAEDVVEAPETAPPDISTQLTDAQAKASEYLDGWQRARAELDNYRKRMDRERSEWGDRIKAETLLNILPAIDDFDLALANLPQDIAEHEWVNGLLLVSRKFAAQMTAMGLSEIDAVGKSFDPLLHEAITHEASPDHQTGEIIGVVRKGYKIGDKVIRPALVRVAS